MWEYSERQRYKIVVISVLYVLFFQVYNTLFTYDEKACADGRVHASTWYPWDPWLCAVIPDLNKAVEKHFPLFANSFLSVKDGIFAHVLTVCLFLGLFYVFIFAVVGCWLSWRGGRERCWQMKTVLNYTWRYMLRYVR